MTPVAYWAERNSALDATRNATRNGQAGKRHVVTHLIGGYDAMSNTGNIELVVEGVQVAELAIEGRTRSWPVNFRADIGQEVQGRVRAGGIGVTGYVNIMGYTE